MNFPQEKPEDSTASLQTFYSKHILGPDGRPTAKWQTDNLTRITTPFPLTLSFDTSKQVTKILCHKKVADSLLRVYERILAHYGSFEEVKKARMHLFAGCFNFRLVGGSSRLSTHAFGAGIDIDSEKNPRGKKHDPSPAKKMMPLEVVKIFKEEGWRWGGDFRKIPDAMHFQATK